jgi:hypothetical protein
LFSDIIANMHRWHYGRNVNFIIRHNHRDEVEEAAADVPSPAVAKKDPTSSDNSTYTPDDLPPEYSITTAVAKAQAASDTGKGTTPPAASPKVSGAKKESPKVSGAKKESPKVSGAKKESPKVSGAKKEVAVKVVVKRVPTKGGPLDQADAKGGEKSKDTVTKE